MSPKLQASALTTGPSLLFKKYYLFITSDLNFSDVSLCRTTIGGSTAEDGNVYGGTAANLHGMDQAEEMWYFGILFAIWCNCFITY